MWPKRVTTKNVHIIWHPYVSDVIKGIYDLGAPPGICMIKLGSSLERSLCFGCNKGLYNLGAPPGICMVKFGSSLERSLRFGCNKRHTITDPVLQIFRSKLHRAL